ATVHDLQHRPQSRRHVAAGDPAAVVIKPGWRQVLGGTCELRLAMLAQRHRDGLLGWQNEKRSLLRRAHIAGEEQRALVRHACVPYMGSIASIMVGRLKPAIARDVKRTWAMPDTRSPSPLPPLLQSFDDPLGRKIIELHVWSVG